MNLTEIIDDKIILKMYLLFILKYEYQCIINIFGYIRFKKSRLRCQDLSLFFKHCIRFGLIIFL